MRNRKPQHLHANQVILDTIGNLVGVPISKTSNNTIGFQKEDAEALPPREEDHTFDAKEFAQRVPILGTSQIIGSGMEQLDQAV